MAAPHPPPDPLGDSPKPHLAVCAFDVMVSRHNLGLAEKSMPRHPEFQYGNVRVLPIYAGDLGGAALRIQEELSAGRLQFSAGVFSSILDALLGALIGTTASDAGDDWMRDSFFEMVAEGEPEDPGGHHDHN